MTESWPTRRDFLQTTLAGSAALGLAAAADAGEDASTGLPTRPLGKTGVKVSMLCLGGWHIGSVKDPSEAIKIMHTAIDEGLTFFDNAWDYHDGGSDLGIGQTSTLQPQDLHLALDTGVGMMAAVVANPCQIFRSEVVQTHGCRSSAEQGTSNYAVEIHLSCGNSASIIPAEYISAAIPVKTGLASRGSGSRTTNATAGRFVSF